MNKKYVTTGCVLFTVILSGCGQIAENNSSEELGEGRTVEHELGSTVVPNNPQNVVTLELGITETAVALGINPIGIADDDQPERIAESTMSQLDDYTSVGARSEPSLELIRSLNPDLILVDVDRHENIYKELGDIAPTVAVIHDTGNYEEILSSTEIIGNALDETEKTNELLEDHQQRVTMLKTNTSSYEGSVLQAQYTSNNLFGAPTSSYFMPSFMEEIGIEYALDNDTEDSQDLTIEQILSIDPTTLILTTSDDEPSPIEQLQNDKLYNRLQAVENDKVFEMEHNDMSRRRSIMAVNEQIDTLEDIFTNTAP